MFNIGFGWFDYTEPSLTASLQGEQGLEGNCTLVPGGSSASNLLTPPQNAQSRCVVVFNMGSESFDHSEPSLNISLQGEQGVEGNCTLVPGGSTALNLLAPLLLLK